MGITGIDMESGSIVIRWIRIKHLIRTVNQQTKQNTNLR